MEFLLHILQIRGNEERKQSNQNWDPEKNRNLEEKREETKLCDICFEEKSLTLL